MPIQTLPSSTRQALGRVNRRLDRIPPNADSTQLLRMVDANWGRISRGSDMISRSEGAWIAELASHHAANAEVLKALVEQTEGMALSSSARRAGVADLLDQIRAAAAAGTTTAPPSPPTDPVDPPVVQPPLPPVTDPGTLPTPDRPSGPGNVIDVIAGGGQVDTSGTAAQPVNVEPVQPYANAQHPFQFEGTPTYTGDRLDPAALRTTFNGVPGERFGTTKVNLPGGAANIVNDALYPLEGGKVGMHIIGADDGASASQKVDAYLRKESGIGADDPIFAFGNYFHPEEHEGSLETFAGRSYKPQQAFSHTMAYVGKGVTTNAPRSMNDRWNFGGTAVNMTLLSLEGTDQVTLNKNGQTVDSILNHDVAFASDYTDDNYRTVDINTTLSFYRDWIREKPYLKDGAWKTYCAEHKTMVANVMVNVPHNPAAFREIFGTMEGNKLWLEFKAKFKEANGREFPAADETKFEPLWKKEGLTPEQIRPWKNEAEFDAYNTARKNGDLDNYSGFRPAEPGLGLIWPPETTADLVHSFVELYTPVHEVGGPMACASVMAFKDKVKDRIGMSEDAYMQHALAAMNKMMVADAMMRADGPDYATRAAGELYVAFGGDQADLMAGQPKPELMGLVDLALTGVKAELANILTNPQRPRDPAARAEAADAWLQQAIQPDLEQARKVAVTDPNKSEFNTGPAIFHRASIGNHALNAKVTLKTVCTVIEEENVQ